MSFHIPTGYKSGIGIFSPVPPPIISSTPTLIPPVAPLSKHTMSSFANQAVRFYDPLTGEEQNISSQNNVSRRYNSATTTVDVIGSNADVDRVLSYIRNAENPGSAPPSSTVSYTSEFIPLDAAIGSYKPTSMHTPVVHGSWHYDTSSGRTLLVDPAGKKYSGSGVLILLKMGDNRSVVLAQSITSGKFEDMGGKFDTHKYPASNNAFAYNARNEVEEETAGLFVLQNLNEHNHIDIPDGYDASYRVYFIAIEGTTFDGNTIANAFLENKKSVHVRLNADSNLKKADWDETSALASFSLSKLPLNMISDRTQIILNKLTTGGLVEMLFNNPKKVQLNKVNIPRTAVQANAILIN